MGRLRKMKVNLYRRTPLLQCESALLICGVDVRCWSAALINSLSINSVLICDDDLRCYFGSVSSALSVCSVDLRGCPCGVDSARLICRCGSSVDNGAVSI